MSQTEEQQVEQLKQWWKENGVSIFVGACIALAGVSGYKYYQGSQIEEAKAASGVYVQMLNAIDKEEIAAASNLAEQLVAQYSSTTYGGLALMMQAKLSVEAGEFDAAIAQLNQAVKASNDPVNSEARLRLFDVQLAKGDIDAAIAALNVKMPEAFEAAKQERLGDAYAKQGDTEAAKVAYDKALESAKANSYNTRILHNKRDNLS